MTIKRVLAEVTAAYIPDCRYLKSAECEFPGIRGHFEILRPFYCTPKTGHFNAVEAVLCFNQLTYTMFGKFFDEGAIESVGRIPLEEFLKLQAGSCYIARMSELTFKKPINPQSFEGKINLIKAPRRGNVVFFYTDFGFEDANGGNASGEALLALKLD